MPVVYRVFFKIIFYSAPKMIIYSPSCCSSQHWTLVNFFMNKVQ